ncbi:MAG: DUF2237 domain-containing protein [Deltaproteobacteria bacterium]|nr:MAG: DUF2237 domain-containing protein [Deltaproteobacteria bacterium]
MAANEDRLNVLGESLHLCCGAPATGFYRDGYCRASAPDAGTHTVCSIVTQQFLTFSREHGNDLQTPRPEFNFPGLKEGDRWCLCATRWKEALQAGVAPPVDLAATDERTLRYVDLDELKAHAY